MLEETKEGPKKCEPKSPGNNMPRSFGGSNKSLVAITTASPKDVVRATNCGL